MCTVTIRGPSAKDLYGYKPSARYKYSEISACLLAILELKVGGNIDSIICCGTQGTDWLFYTASQHYRQYNDRTKLYLYEPFPGVDARWKDFGLFNKKDYQSRRASAETRNELVLCNGKVPSTPREYGYMMQNTYDQALDKADILICISPWKITDGKLCVRDQDMLSCAFRAARLGKRVILVSQEDLSILSHAQEYLS